MKRHITKTFAIVIISGCLSSCWTQKNLTTVRNEPISEQTLSQLVPGRTYFLYDRGTKKKKVLVHRIDSKVIIGEIDGYEGYKKSNCKSCQLTFDEIENDYTKITLRKFNLAATISLAVVGGAIALFLAWLLIEILFWAIWF